MVSAAKLRRAQDRVIAARPYAATLRKVISNVAAAAAGDDRVSSNPLLAQRPEKRVLLALVSGDKGLAGAFNSNLIKAAVRFPAEHNGAEMTFELVGRKGRDFFRKRNAKISGDQIGLAAKPSYQETAGNCAPRHAIVFGWRSGCGLPALQRIQERDDAEGDALAHPAGGGSGRAGRGGLHFRAAAGRNAGRPAAALCRDGVLSGAARIFRGRTCRAHDRHGCGDE